MTVDTNSYNLVDYSKNSNDPLIRKTSISMIKAGSIFTDIPFVEKKSLKVNGSRWLDNLPTPTWRPLNQEAAAVKGAPTPWQEQAWVMRDYIDIDEFLSLDENSIVNPFDQQTEAYLQGFSYDINDKVINNNHATGDKNAPVGIRARLDDPTYGANPACKIDGGGVDISDTGLANGTTTRKLNRLVQQALDEMGVPDGNGVVIYANDNVIRRWEDGVRAMGAGGFETTQDGYDRPVPSFRQAKIRRIGRKAPLPGGVQSTYIISDTETSTGLDGASTFSSIYLVRFGVEYFCGWQFFPLKPRPKFTTDGGIIERVVFSWAMGLMQPNTRAVARIYNVKVS